MAIPETIKHLYNKYPNEWGENFERTTDAEVDALGSLLSFRIPHEYREWVKYMTNIDAGAGYFYGLKRHPPMNYSVYDVYEEYPQWINSRWIPVADDGLGNRFVLLADHSGDFQPIVIVYDAIDPNKPECIVASSLFNFLRGFLQDGLEKPDVSWWARERTEVLAKDPDISIVAGLAYPWDA